MRLSPATKKRLIRRLKKHRSSILRIVDEMEETRLEIEALDDICWDADDDRAHRDTGA